MTDAVVVFTFKRPSAFYLENKKREQEKGQDPIWQFRQTLIGPWQLGNFHPPGWKAKGMKLPEPGNSPEQRDKPRPGYQKGSRPL